MPDDSLINEGYDSDFQVGPFIQSGVAEEAFVCMDEEAPEEPEPVLLAAVECENSDEVHVDAVEAVPEVPEITDENIDKMKVSELRVELERRGMSKNGLKAVLIQRLKEAVSQKVPLLTDRPDDEVANNAGDGFDGGAFWQLLEPEGPELDESCMEVDGVRFRAPTTTELEHNSNHPDRPKKRNYSATFDRSPFVSHQQLLPEKNLRGRFRKDNKGNFKYSKQTTTETIPNIEFLHSHGINLQSHPAQWFDIFFPRKRERTTHPKAVTFDELTGWTNTKALMQNAGVGGGKYKNFKNFSSQELMSHLSLYMLHGISPSPQVDLKFKCHQDDPVNGSDLCFEVFGKAGVTRHKEFKAFFSATDPIKPTPSPSTHPNWKIDPCLKHMMRVAKECICLGENISIDEQDIGFQGMHKDKQRINYKKVGDGFLVDALSADGYTYS